MAKNMRRIAIDDNKSKPVQDNGYANVEYVREELREMLPAYKIVSDCIAGARAVKAAGETYLPCPNETDTSEENKARYRQYLKRAVFYNVTRRTVFALAGQIFLRDPQIDIPPALQPLVLDANGENVPLQQHAEKMCRNVISFGRAGLLADFPTTGGNIAAADLTADDMRPVLTAYQSHDIINWRKAQRGGKRIYTLIVLREPYTEYDNGFAAIRLTQYRVLRLVPAEVAKSVLAAAFPAGLDPLFDAAIDTAIARASDVYYVEVWQQTTSLANVIGFTPVEQYFPTDKDGNFLNEIPWQFVGAEHNDDTIDMPPVGDLADLNIAHYRNSADYEETSFLTGQPTPFVSGITEEWNKEVLKGVIQLGSRGVIPLPAGGTAGLMQADANSVPIEAMTQKERQMVALGAKLVEQRQVQRTATEAQLESAADTSVLATVAKNVSAAYQAVLRKACVFTGDDAEQVFFILNAEFDLLRMDANERAQLMLEWQAGAIVTEEMRANLRRGGVATLNDKDYTQLAKVDEQARAEKAQAAAEVAMKAKGADPNNPPGRNPAKPTEPVKANQ